jgi:hypothetical protein
MALGQYTSPDTAKPGARGPHQRRMASRVPLLRSGRGERVIADRLATPEPPLGGSRETRPSERRRTGEPWSARLGLPRPGSRIIGYDEAD